MPIYLQIIFGTISTLAVIGGAAIAVIKWVVHQNKQTDDIAALRKQHEKDIAESKEKESQDIQVIKDELCVLSYAMLAALDGLMQQGCNWNVTKAHDSLEKHLNKQAHGQNDKH